VVRDALSGGVDLEAALTVAAIVGWVHLQGALLGRVAGCLAKSVSQFGRAPFLNPRSPASGRPHEISGL